MPSKNDDDAKVDLHLPDTTIHNASQLPEPTNNKTPCPTEEAELFASYDDFPEDDDEPTKEDERYFLSEERFFTKLNHKFVARGYKRPILTLRSETRRKYKNFRVTKREDKRKNEKFRECYISPLTKKSNEESGPTATDGRNFTPATQTGTSQPSSTSCPPASTTAAADSKAAENARYLSITQEQEYQEALRRSSADIAPATGISLQQMLDMLNRDLTPEDYEMLLRLDEAVAKKTVKQETLTTLTEKTIEEEALLSEICTICMFNYEMGDNVKYLPCNHFFHVDCIVPYLSSYGQSCPVCKAKV